MMPGSRPICLLCRLGQLAVNQAPYATPRAGYRLAARNNARLGSRKARYDHRRWQSSAQAAVAPQEVLQDVSNLEAEQRRPAMPPLQELLSQEVSAEAEQAALRKRDQTKSNVLSSPKEILRSGIGDQPTRSKRATSYNIHIRIDGSVYPFSPILLRDMCSCPKCVDPSTRQKLFSTTEIPRDICAKSMEVGEHRVKIVWEPDLPGLTGEHVTELPTAKLKHLATEGRLEPLGFAENAPRNLWNGDMFKEQVEDVHYDDYMQDEATLLAALRTLHTHGLLFVTGVPGDEKSVANVAERIGPLKNTFYGDTWDVRSVPEAKNVAYTSQHLGFHMDLMYMHQPPHLQLLHCIRSSSTGGASLFADSYRAVNQVFRTDRRAFRELARPRSVHFHYDHHPNHHYSQSRAVVELKSHFPNASKTDISAAIANVSWAPPFQSPFLEPSNQRNLNADVNIWHAAASKFSALIHEPAAIYERLMKPGECVIFDNRRVLHARKAFELSDAGTERWLRGAYVDWDPYISRMRTLERKLSA